MTITAYVGLPGSGKSYSVVDHVIRPAIASGREVFTNIPVNDEIFIERYGMSVQNCEVDEIKQNGDWWKNEFRAGAVLVLDELWRLWPSGLNANKIRETDKSFLAEHRHMVGDNGKSTEIVFVTQDLNQVANYVRLLIETTYRSTKLSKVGMPNSFRVDIYQGPAAGPNPPVRNRLSSLTYKYKQEVFDLYKSHTMSSVGAGDESVIDKRNNLLGGFMPKVIGVCIVVFSLFGYLFYSSLGAEQAEQAEQVEGYGDTKEKPNEVIRKKRTRVNPLQGASYEIVSNMGSAPNYNYVVSVSISGGEAEFTKMDLSRMGYRVVPINQCALRLIGHDSEHLVMCGTDESEIETINFLAGE